MVDEASGDLVDELEDVVAGIWRELGPALRADAERLAARIDELGDDPTARAPEGTPDPRWLEVRELAHRLAGSLGSLGQRRAGEAAVALEDLTAGRTHPDSADWPVIVTRAEQLLEALSEPTSGDGTDRG